MHSNSEGLSPSLRAQLGVGWNRALPAPFGFDNCILPDGVNDQLIAMAHKGQAMPTQITFSAWLHISPADSIMFISSYIPGSGGLEVSIAVDSPGNLRVRFFGDNAGQIHQAPILAAATLYYVVFTHDFLTKKTELFVDTVRVLSIVSSYAETYNANPIQHSGPLQRMSQAGHWAAKLDEAILYNRIISTDEIITNYNDGAGNNPTKTEGIIWWFDFNKAEIDTDLNPGGNPAGWTAGSWGIRDKSPNQYHAMQMNFSANNSSLGGAIQPLMT